MIRIERFAACLLAAAMLGLAPADALAQKGKKKKGKKGNAAQVDGAKKGGKDKLKSVGESVSYTHLTLPTSIQV